MSHGRLTISLELMVPSGVLLLVLDRGQRRLLPAWLEDRALHKSSQSLNGM